MSPLSLRLITDIPLSVPHSPQKLITENSSSAVVPLSQDAEPIEPDKKRDGVLDTGLRVVPPVTLLHKYLLCANGILKTKLEVNNQVFIMFIKYIHNILHIL